MERTPVISNTNKDIQPMASISIIAKPVEVTDLLPKIEYALNNVTISAEAKDLQEMLVAFIKQNDNLINEGKELLPDQVQGFISGFRNSLAIVNLWIDSLYVVQNPNN